MGLFIRIFKFLNSFTINNNVIPKDSKSATTNEPNTPDIPKNIGNIIANGISKMNCLKADKTTDCFTLPTY